MNIDLTNIIEKGTRFAEQASSEDKACHYDLAMKAYMAASDCFIHVIKYGIVDEETKQTIHAKVENYMKRVEEIKNTTENEITKKEQLVDNNEIDDRVIETFFTDSKVTFDDVIGLADAKTKLLEDVILTVKFPELFQDKCKSSPFILIYGAPGVGKTYLAKSIAAECKGTFFRLDSWQLYMKWRGSSERSIQSLFKLVRERQPCILLFDDIDGVFGQRDDSGLDLIQQRMLTEFLTQIEAIKNDNANVLLLAVTGCPWTLSPNIRRGFEKWIYIPLPNLEERAAMFKTHLGTDTRHTIKDNEWIELAKKADYYSGADISVVCREALYRPLRQLSAATHFKRAPNPELNGRQQLWFMCLAEDPDAEMITLDKMEPDEIYLPPVTMSDMLAALDTIKHSVAEVDLAKYRQFTEELGENIA